MRRIKIWQQNRKGQFLVLTGLLLTVLLAMTALAVDLGVIKLVRTQLQAASDSGSLAAGTELLPGLGAAAFRTPDQVKARAETQAVDFVSRHPAGEAASAHIEAARDMRFGKAKMNLARTSWQFTWGVTPYNAVEVSTLRSEAGSTSGDSPLPLIFARILGHQTSNVTANSVAVIMPANGIRFPPGSVHGSGLSPFAFSRQRWLKYWRARDYFVSHGMTDADITVANNAHLITDPLDLDANGNPLPLFFEKIPQGNIITYRKLFGDAYRVVNPELQTASNIVNQPDGILEANIYPIGSTAGNFGTVNIGNDSNSTQVLKDQITNGITAQYLAQYENGTLTFDPDSPFILNGDTGISSGIEASLSAIVGQIRAIVLYDTVVNPGNNAAYTIVDWAGIRIMAVDLSGRNKVLVIQPDVISDPSFTPDYDGDISDRTTIFSPLILAR